MTHAALALQGAIFEKLAASPELETLLGRQAVFDHVPEKEKLPYVVFAEATHTDWSTGTEAGIEHRITLHAWSCERGRKEVLEIADTITTTLLSMPDEIDGHALINLRHLSTEVGRDRETGLFLAKVKLRGVTEPL